MKPLINSSWRFFKWSLLASVLAGLVAVPYVYSRINGEIRTQVQEHFAKHYSHLVVEVRSARLVKGEGIEIRGLSLSEPAGKNRRDQQELAFFDEIFLYCNTDLQGLLSGPPRIRRFLLRRPRLRAVQSSDGSWNLARLWPPPHCGGTLKGKIEDGTIELASPANPAVTVTALRGIDVTVGSGHDLDSEWPAKSILIRASLGGDHVDHVEFEGLVDPAKKRWTVSGSVAGLDLSPELHASLPAAVAQQAAPLKSLRAQAGFDFRASQDPARGKPLRFDLSGRIARGRIDDPRLPYPLTDLRAAFQANNGGLTIDNLKAASGQMTLEMSLQLQGFTLRSPLRVTARSKHFTLNNQLVDFLPPQFRDVWGKFLPEGEIDLELKQLTFDGRKWHPDLVVHCLNVGFTYYKFPYRLEHASGTVELKENVLAFDLNAREGGEVQIHGRIEDPGPDFSGEVVVEGQEQRIDEKLLLALSEKHRQVVRSLNPSGSFDIFTRLTRRPGANAELRKEMRVDLNRCSLSFAKFPYPVANIRGVLEVADDQWKFHDLTGSNGSGRITCQGELAPAARGGELLLRFTGEGISLDDELRNSLKPDVRRVWADLRPQGLVELPDVTVHYDPRGRRLSVSVTIEPRGDTVSIQPVAFPYRLEKLHGTLSYRDGRVDLRKIRAEHGRVTLTTDGYCTMTSGGAWQLHLDPLAVDRVRPDRELMEALPERLKKAIARLSLSGPLNLGGSLDFNRPRNGAPLEAGWDLRFDLHQASLDTGVRLEGIEGELRLTGGWNAKGLKSRGEMQLDSLLLRGFQFTDVEGPLWIDDSQVLLGAWAWEPSGQRQRRHVQGNLLGGRVEIDSRVTLGDSPRYVLNATLAEADLARATQEAFPGRQQLQGKVFANVELHGAGHGANTLTGRGNVQLSDADIYELPVMVQLLKILSVKPPDKTGFDKSTIDFRLEGGHIYFDRIDFTGNAISLKGQGEMNLDNEIRLSFTPIVGRDELYVPLFSDLVGGASQQLMQIHVGGTLSEPVTRKEPFPALNHAFEQWQADLQGEAGMRRPPAGNLPAANRPRRNNGPVIDY